MRVLITGAQGFIGTTLARSLHARGEVGGRPLEALALTDRDLTPTSAAVSGAQAIAGNLLGAGVHEAIRQFRPDITFHLASVPGGAAEADYETGRRTNLDASLALFETLAQQGRRPVVVFASSIAVYGSALPPVVAPATSLNPPLTYGAHKLACEILLADLSRRGQLDGRSLRLPGIVARPQSRAGLASAFMSDLLHALSEGRSYTCPVGPLATAWWMSAARCAENLLHAATMDLSEADPRRAWPLPVLRLSMQEVVAAGAALFGADRQTLVQYEGQEALEAVFGRYPALDDSDSRALGLRDDGDATALIRRALSLDGA